MFNPGSSKTGPPQPSKAKIIPLEKIADFRASSHMRGLDCKEIRHMEAVAGCDGLYAGASVARSHSAADEIALTLRRLRLLAGHPALPRVTRRPSLRATRP